MTRTTRMTRKGTAFLSFALFLISTPTALGVDFPPHQYGSKPKYAERPQPSAYELALLRTKTAVAEGRVADPAARRTDGTPGTLLDAILPESLPEAEKHRRRLQWRANWRFLGANIPFLQGPTAAALNSSFFRYASVNPWYVVDWRSTPYITPILVQYDCSSCWAMAAVDTVAMANAIAKAVPPVVPSVQQLCDCSGLGCCQGGWPEQAFAWLVSTGNVSSADNYSYWATDGRTCLNTSSFSVAGQINGWERVPIFSQDALMKAVSMQPVLVYISASSKDFQNYSSTAPGTPGFTVYDGNCSMEVNHVVVVVGFDRTGVVPYWIVKNTWIPSGWGHNGYMYIAMYDGPGKCGMLTVNPLFPVFFPNAPVQMTVSQSSPYPLLSYNNFWWRWWSWIGNPCNNILNPCGSGTCYIDSNNIARCLCSYPYVEIVGVPTSKCVEPSPCWSGMFNPCGAGWCVDVGDGSYICGCPPGYGLGVRVGGAPTCVPVSTLSTQPRIYTAQYNDTCSSIRAGYNLTSAQFTALNPYIQCSGFLVPGLAITLSSATICTQQYAVRPGDTCGNIAYYMDYSSNFRSVLNSSLWSYPRTLLYDIPLLSTYSVYTTYTPTSLVALNPTINCASLYLSQQVCVTKAGSNNSATPVICGQTYTTQQWDTCWGIRSAFGLSSAAFLRLNPGLNCNFNNGYFYAGVQICILEATPGSQVNVTCTQWYTVQQGDTCAQIWNAANMSQYQLLYINPGLQCQPPFLYVGRPICVDAPLLANIPDPSYLTYTVQPSDTWSYIQAQFSTRCQPFSITVDRIARQNNISNWVNYTFVAGQVLVIPCISKIGALCGCVDSLPICGAYFQNYNSYCEARCNFATPVTNGPCSACQLACVGRHGLPPSTPSACPANYLCPWPTWPPPLADAAAVFNFTRRPLCSYRAATCIRACILYNSILGLSVLDATCLNLCTACHMVPCSGPSNFIPEGAFPCASCANSGCNDAGKGYCATDCPYWNSIWNPLNP